MAFAALGSFASDVFSQARASMQAAQSVERKADLGDLALAYHERRNVPPTPLPESATVLVLTWNVYGQGISEADLLGELLFGGRDVAPDVVVIGVQELIGLNPAHCMMKANGDFDREDELDARVRQCLQAAGTYYKVRSVGMVGLYLSVYVREHLVEHILEPDADRIRTTTEGLAGKKGAVAVRFTLCEQSLCFVNAHLPSGEREVERRTALRTILREAFQGKNVLGGERPSKLGFSRDSGRTLAGHDCAFLFGDLNFRPEISLEELPNLPHMGPADLMALRALDPSQCGCVDEVLGAFSEGEITFPPTYKYKPGTAVIDERRVPAWTDRVFFKGKCAKQLRYQGHMQHIHTSDHRPVSALFELGFKLAEKHASVPVGSASGASVGASVASVGAASGESGDAKVEPPFSLGSKPADEG